MNKLSALCTFQMKSMKWNQLIKYSKSILVYESIPSQLACQLVNLFDHICIPGYIKRQ